MAADPGRAEQGRRLAVLRRRLFFVSTALSALFLVAVIAADGLRWAVGLTPLPALDGAIAAVALLSIYTLLTAPLSWYSGFVLSHRFGLSTQSLGSWLADQLKSLALGAAFLAALAAALYVLLGWFPEVWWLALAVVILVATVGLAQLGPVLLLPLFYRLQKLDDQELLDRLNRMANRAGARISGVYEMEMSAKTTATNAALAGLGSTRRVILGDAMRKQYTTEEIEAVLAHELAHHVHNDIPKLIAVSTVTTLAGLFLVSLVLTPLAAVAGVPDILSARSLPLIALVIGAFFFLTTPLTNWFSRVVEHQADVFALRFLPTPAPFLSMMEKLADQNLAEPEPSPLVEAFFYDHPHHAKRLRFARSWTAAGRA